MTDIKFAVRQLIGSPGFTAVAVLSLALGIGTCTAVFTLLNAVVVRELPYREPDRLVRVWDSNQKRNLTSFPASIPNFLSWQERSSTFAGFAARRYGTATVGAGTQTERLGALAVTHLMRSLLYEVAPFDPLCFAGVAVLSLAIGLLASFVPARRVTCINPVEALHHE